MAQIRQRILSRAGGVFLGALLVFCPALAARKFYPDDPLWREPKPLPVNGVKAEKPNDFYNFLERSFSKPVREHVPAQSANTLGEVPDSAWYHNRRDWNAMSIADLVRGPGVARGPAMNGRWRIVSAKNEGVTPGLIFEDAAQRRYVLKFDPLDYPELASAADVIGCKFFYAFGYNTPENHIVHFDRGQLEVMPKTQFKDEGGRMRSMTERDVDRLLAKVPRDAAGRYRGMASLFIGGDIVGPFSFSGTRPDDPNDYIPHEDRRELRGLYVFAAWLNHTDCKSINSLDTLVNKAGTRFIKHYLIDFGAILGSDSVMPKDPRAGNQYMFDAKPAALELFSLGAWVPRWQTMEFPRIRGVGNFESSIFDPEKWKTNYPNEAFDRRLPDDTFWAAKKVMAFTGEQIRAIVATGEYSDPAAVDYITKTLIERRDKIGRAYFKDVLPLDGFRVNQGKLEFEDLAAKYMFRAPLNCRVQWSWFDNSTGRKTTLAGENTFRIPRDRHEYLAADIDGGERNKTVTVYLHNEAGRMEVVGIDRSW